MHIGEAEIPTGVAVSELLVVEAEETQDRGMQVVDVHRLLHGFESELVRRPVYLATLHPATGHPQSKSIVVVIPTVNLSRV